MSTDLRSAALPVTADVVRHVGGSHFDQNTGLVMGSAFDRTEKDTDGLSFTQTGQFSVNVADDRNHIRDIIGSRKKLGKTSQFVELNVGEVLDALLYFSSDFFFQHDPLPANGAELANPAHCLLIGLPFKGEAVGSLRSELAGDLIAQKVKATFPAVDV